MALIRFILPFVLCCLLVSACGQGNSTQPAAKPAQRSISKDWGYLLSDATRNYLLEKQAFEQANITAESHPAEFALYKEWDDYFFLRKVPKGGLPDRTELYELGNEYAQQHPVTAGNWKVIESQNNEPTGRLNAIVVDPTNPDTWYACAPAGGLWRLASPTQKWEPLTDQLALVGVSSVAIDPSNGNTIYIGTGDRDHCDAVGLGVFKSTNHGNSWAEVNTGLGRLTVTKLLIHPTETNIVLAATESGLFRSESGGENWQRVSPNVHKYYELVFHPANPEIVYACDYNFFWRSTDGGLTWLEAGTGLPETGASRLAIAVSPADANRVYVGAANVGGQMALFQSNDAGESFAAVASSELGNSYAIAASWYNFALAADPANPDFVFVGGNAVHAFSLVKGTVSAPALVSGYQFGSVHGFAMHPATGKPIVASDHGCYFLNRNEWQPMQPGLQLDRVNDVAAGPNENHLFAATNSGIKLQAGSAAMHSSPMKGAGGTVVWSAGAALYAATHNNEMQATALSKETGDEIAQIASSATIRENYALRIPVVAEKQVPNQLTIGLENLWRCTIDPAKPTEKKLWTRLNELDNEGPVRIIAQSPANPDIAYFSDGPNVFTSTNFTEGAPTWLNLTDRVPIKANIGFIEPHPANEFDSYLAVQQTVFRSDDKGQNWKNASGGLPDAYLTCMAIEPFPPYGRYIGTDYGVWYQDDNTGNWIPFNNNLPANVRVTSLALTGDGKHVVVGTYGRGTWVSPTCNQLRDHESPNAKYRAFRNKDSGQLTISVAYADLDVLQLSITDPIAGTATNAPDIFVKKDGSGSVSLDWNGAWKNGVWVEFRSVNNVRVARMFVGY